MAILIDSSVWIDFFNGVSTPETDGLNALLGSAELVVGDLILAEVLQGFRSRRDFEVARKALTLFPVLQMGGAKLAVQSAQNYRALRAQGVTVRKTIDCLIATFCIEERLALLHSDRDFDPFERYLGLQVLRPKG